MQTRSHKIGKRAIYNLTYGLLDEGPDARDKSLKQMVGAKGFEPSTSWSRTRREDLLEPMDSC
jgi:hypothetical protein